MINNLTKETNRCGEGGIGEALVKEYARQGVHPIATLLPFESSSHLSSAGITWFPLDVTKEASITDLKSHVFDLTDGCLDFMVNNAYVILELIPDSFAIIIRPANYGFTEESVRLSSLPSTPIRVLKSSPCYTMTAIDTDVAAVGKMFDVNVLGPMRMVHHFHDVLIQSSGTIVNIGSVGGIVPYVYGGRSRYIYHFWQIQGDRLKSSCY